MMFGLLFGGVAALLTALALAVVYCKKGRPHPTANLVLTLWISEGLTQA